MDQSPSSRLERCSISRRNADCSPLALHLGSVSAASRLYLAQVVKEGLRLFSPAANIIKTSPPDKESRLGPYCVPPGTNLIISFWGACDPKGAAEPPILHLPVEFHRRAAPQPRGLPEPAQVRPRPVVARRGGQALALRLGPVQLRKARLHRASAATSAPAVRWAVST